MHLDTLFGIQRHAVVNNQVDGASDNHTFVILRILVNHPPAFGPVVHVQNRCGILGCLPIAIGINITVCGNSCRIKRLDGTTACHVSASTDSHLSVYVMTSHEHLAIADVAIRCGGTASKHNSRTSQCAIYRCIVSQADSSTIAAISRHRTTIDSDGLHGSRITTTDTSSSKATSSIDSTAIDGDAARDVVNIGIVSKRRIRHCQTAIFTAADTSSATSLIVINIPRSALSIDSTTIDDDRSQALRNNHVGLGLCVLAITQRTNTGTTTVVLATGSIQRTSTGSGYLQRTTGRHRNACTAKACLQGVCAIDGQVQRGTVSQGDTRTGRKGLGIVGVEAVDGQVQFDSVHHDGTGTGKGCIVTRIGTCRHGTSDTLVVVGRLVTTVDYYSRVLRNICCPHA